MSGQDLLPLLLVLAASWVGNFLAGFFNAEALGVKLRDWIIRKRKK
jgi:hypothetical protein